MDFETIMYQSPMNRDIMDSIRLNSFMPRQCYGCGYPSIYGHNPMRTRAQADEFVHNQQVKKEKTKKAVITSAILAAVAVAAAIVCKKTNVLKSPAVQNAIKVVKDKFAGLTTKAKPYLDKAKTGITNAFGKLKNVFHKAPKTP